MLRKRTKNEMQTQEMLDLLLADKSPAMQVQAKFDNDLHMVLKPAIFGKMLGITSLFTESRKDLQYYKHKMLKKL